MTRITIIQKRPYSFVSGEGQTIKGFMYAGFLEKGEVVEFSSQNGKHQETIATGFDDDLAVNILLRPKVFKGKVKFVEAAEDATENEDE